MDKFTELQRYAMCLTQALLGVISHNFRMVSISHQARGIVIRILLTGACDEDFEEIDDLRSEFGALLPGPVHYDFEVNITQEPIMFEPPSNSTIVVFRRREDV